MKEFIRLINIAIQTLEIWDKEKTKEQVKGLKLAIEIAKNLKYEK